jgi:heme-degrading monooxygenase HmoA
MFVVLYRWRIKSGHEDEFRDAWRRATNKITERYGALGSRLHRVDDGSWLAYAQWPDRERWQLMRSSAPVAPEEFTTMQRLEDASASFPFPFLTMELTDDELAPPTARQRKGPA